MTFIDELRSRPDLLKDPENLKPTGETITVFQRVAKEISSGELGRQIDRSVRRQAAAWGRMANQIVGQER